jgi:hypothetical protein
MARIKRVPTTTIRTRLAERERIDGAERAKRFQSLGDKDAMTRHKHNLAALESDEPVLLQDWRLMFALDGEEARAVHAIGGEFVLHTDGTYEPATSTTQGRRLMG